MESHIFNYGNFTNYSNFEILTLKLFNLRNHKIRKYVNFPNPLIIERSNLKNS